MIKGRTIPSNGPSDMLILEKNVCTVKLLYTGLVSAVLDSPVKASWVKACGFRKK